jgi:hypothetical protein
MSRREIPRGRGATSKIGAARRRAAGAVLCTSIAALVLAAFPALAAATQPFIYSGPTAARTAGGYTLSAGIYTYELDTHYHFEYGTTTSYGTNVPNFPVEAEADAGSGPGLGAVPVSQGIGDLAPSTTYHVRLVAHNSSGSTMSPDQVFTTSAPAPDVAADPATPTVEGFKLNGTINPHGADTTYRFEYGTTTSYGTKIPTPPASEVDAGSGSTAASVFQEVKGTDLLPNTLYHFRLTAKNAGGSTSSTDQTFMTLPSAPGKPSAVANPVIANPPGGYKLEGEVNPNGVETTYRFEYGLADCASNPCTGVPALGAGIGEGTTSVPVFQEVTGLAVNTTYHYRIVASNSEGTGISTDRTFTTAPNPPVVVTTPFTETAGGFELNGTVNPNGGETTYHFLFGITEAYGALIPEPDATVPGTGISPVAVSQLVTGLPPDVPYHYRLVAENAGGVTMGEDQFFMTPPAAASAEASQPPPVLPLPAIVPALAPPSNQLTVKPAVARGAGATMQISVPGAGTVSATGKGLKTVTSISKGPGVVTLKLKLTAAGMKQLRKAPSHKLAVKVKIAFQPNGGKVGTTTKTVTFKLGGT